jgi:mRNA interferase RelE/StbE
LIYNVVFDDKVIKDFKKIDKTWQKKIIQTIKKKLVNDPFVGKKLVGDLSPFYSLRVGNYLLIYEIIKHELVVTVIHIKHRKNVYKD